MDKPLWGVSISRHHNPLPERPSNLRLLRNLGAKPRQQKERLERGVLAQGHVHQDLGPVRGGEELLLDEAHAVAPQAPRPLIERARQQQRQGHGSAAVDTLLRLAGQAPAALPLAAAVKMRVTFCSPVRSRP